MSQLEQTLFKNSLKSTYDTFIANNKNTLSETLLGKEKNLMIKVDTLVSWYTQSADKVTDILPKESIMNSSSSNDDDKKVSSSKKKISRKNSNSKKSAHKKRDANNNNNNNSNKVGVSDVFEFEGLDQNVSIENNNDYLSNDDNEYSSNEDSSSEDDKDSNAESEKDKTINKEKNEMAVLKKRNSNIENIGKIFLINTKHRKRV